MRRGIIIDLRACHRRAYLLVLMVEWKSEYDDGKSAEMDNHTFLIELGVMKATELEYLCLPRTLAPK